MRIHPFVLALAIAGASIPGEVALAANTIDFPDFLEPSNFPAHVQAIHFENCIIDATQGCVWGAWTVSFGAQPPVATYTDNGIAQVGVSGLVCTNSIEGSNPCGPSFSKQACSESLGPHTTVIWIDCPKSIELAP